MTSLDTLARHHAEVTRASVEAIEIPRAPAGGRRHRLVAPRRRVMLAVASFAVVVAGAVVLAGPNRRTPPTTQNHLVTSFGPVEGAAEMEPWLRGFERVEWKGAFIVDNVGGTFVLARMGDAHHEVYNPARSLEPFAPASTFKILSSLIILETHTADLDTVVAWDGVDRGVAGWNRDHTLASAFDASAVWVYEELLGRIDPNVVADFVQRSGYGNELTSGASSTFWIDGDLRISAVEQIEFLTRLTDRSLPFSDETYDAFAEVFVQETGPGWALSYKTGTEATPGATQLGWLVGTVVTEADSWVFALNVDMRPEIVEPSHRLAIMRHILGFENILPAE